jgi:hypothetical protein
VLTVAAVLIAVAATGGVVVLSSGEQATATAQAASASTATVQKGKLSAAVSHELPTRPYLTRQSPLGAHPARRARGDRRFVEGPTDFR